MLFGILGLSLIGSTVPCSDSHQDYVHLAVLRQRQNIPIWSSDGSKIVFSRYPSGVFVVEADGSHLWSLPLDVPLGVGYREGNFAAAISPDGNRVVYSVVKGSKRSNLFVSNLDGGDLRKLTDDKGNDYYPAWSPDGTRIAFISDRTTSTSVPGAHLFVIASDGSDLRELVRTVGLWHIPPVWSPDGTRIAFVALDYPIEGGERYTVHTIQPDGLGLTSLGESASGVTWSPDGTRIAFIAREGHIDSLITVEPDGSEKVALHSFGSSTEAFYDNVLWSPDGSEILYGASDLYEQIGVQVVIVGTDGSGPRRVSVPDGRYKIISAAWSPDNSKIAFHLASEYSDIVLYTTRRDGLEERLLVRGNDLTKIFDATGSLIQINDKRLVAENSDWRNVAADIEACHDGRLVPDPDENPGLVQDCETLLGLRNALAGDAVLHLNWTANVPMSRWTGVQIEGKAPRVVGLNLANFRPTQLSGVIPPELQKLTSLETIDLSANMLTGCLPLELRDSLTSMSLDGLEFC